MGREEAEGCREGEEKCALDDGSAGNSKGRVNIGKGKDKEWGDGKKKKGWR